MSAGNLSKELFVRNEENSKRVMYLAKEFLLNADHIDVVSGTSSANTAARACENLVRLNYVTYDDIKTETTIANDRRRTRLVIRLRKTPNFNSLYEENVANRKKLQEAQN